MDSKCQGLDLTVHLLDQGVVLSVAAGGHQLVSLLPQPVEVGFGTLCWRLS